MARKTNMISVLQFDARSMSLLQVKRSAKGLELAAFRQQSGSWRNEDGSLVEALKSFVQETHIDQDMLCTVLPRHDITTRIIELPTADPVEAASMVRLSAEEYVPYPADELIIDQCILETLPNGTSRVLAALAHQDIVNAHVDVLRQAGLVPERIYLTSACLASVAISASPTPLSEDEPHRFALLNLASGGFEVLIMDRDRLQYGRGIASALDWSKKGEEQAGILEELAIEMRGSLAAYRRETEDGAGAAAIYLSSEMLDITPIAQTLANEMTVPCGTADFALHLVTKGAEQLSVLPAVSLGAALAAQDRAPVVINLLPESLAEQRKLVGVRQKVIRAAILAIAIIAASSGLHYQAVEQRQNLLDALQKQADAIEGSARGVAAKQEQLQILRRQVARDGSVLELLAGICDAAPEGRVNISRFTFERSDGINIWGRAKNLDDVHTFTQNLRDMAKGNLAAFAATHSLYETEDYERDEKVFIYQLAIPFPEEDDEQSAENSR